MFPFPPHPPLKNSHSLPSLPVPPPPSPTPPQINASMNVRLYPVHYLIDKLHCPSAAPPVVTATEIATPMPVVSSVGVDA